MTRRKYEFNVLKPKAVNQWIAESVTKQKSSFHFTGVSLPLFFLSGYSNFLGSVCFVLTKGLYS